jgi:carboxymethylenebutenolidase
MSHVVSITADDGHVLDAYETGLPRSGAVVVILQEIFGVNAHIRGQADLYAREGFLAIAPALFDRVEKHVELSYGDDEREAAKAYASKLKPDLVLKDIAATIAYARGRVPSGKVGVVGFCLGGSYAWLSATRLTPDAAVSYYGSKVAATISETPHAPVIFHFGLNDHAIPLVAVDLIKQARPELPVYLYEAGHGFNCEARSLAFLREKLAP